MTRVGILLPARIETRFDERGPRRTWRLRLVVVPAEAWFDRHDPLVSITELDLLEAAATAAGGDLRGAGETPGRGTAAYEHLAGQVGAARAAWLVDTLVETGPDGGWRVRRDLAPLRVEGTAAASSTIRDLPASIEVWAAVDGDPPRDVKLATLHPAADLPFAPPVTGGPPTFWPRWASMRKAGLTAVVHLATVDPDGGPVDPHDISCLSVVGLGDADPSALFTAHVRAGVAELLAPGTPTNVTPDGGHREPTALAWQATLRRGDATALRARDDVAAALLGDPAGMPDLPGGARDHRSPQHLLVTALWPALWGHALQDLWGTPEEPGRAGLRAAAWWSDHLLPEGPLPTLRIGDQPYGLLPATVLRGSPGAGAGDAPGVEQRTASAVDALIDTVAERAQRAPGTVVDADSDGVARVLRQTATSTTYAYRWMIPTHLLPDPLTEAHQRLAETALAPLGLSAQDAIAPQVGIGAPGAVRLPLVNPPSVGAGEPPAGVWALFEDVAEKLDGQVDVPVPDPADPDTYHRVALLWLWHYASTEAPEPGDGTLDGVLERLVAAFDQDAEQRPHTLLLWLAVQALVVAHAWDPAIPEASERYHATLEALRELALRPHDPPGALERIFRATLDCATHRIDALPSAVAYARLRRMRSAPRVLGLYGWVDRPMRGEPGFSDRGVVLAPSDAQAKSAAILRDRFVAHRSSGQEPPDAWDLCLDSARVRRARGVVEAVRAGAHPGEALGRAVEAVFRLDREIRALRSGYPQDGAAPQRRACDGLALLSDVRDDLDHFAQRTGLDPTGFDPVTRAELDALAAVLDDVADLHLLEAVHDTVQGGTAATREALDALAGLGAGPELRALTTPLAGTTLHTRVLVCVPDVTEPVPSPGDERLVLADPAVASLLDGLGNAADPATFAWRDGAGAVIVTLADLGLRPGDLAVLDDAALAGAVQQAAPTAVVTAPPSGIGRVRRVLALLRRCGDAAVEPSAAERDRLLARYARLHAAAVELLAALAAAPEGTDDPPLRAWSLRWGLTVPPASAADVLRRHLERCAVPDDVVDPVEALRRIAVVGRDGGGVGVPVLVVPAPGVVPDGLAASEDEVAWRSVFERVRPVLGELHAITSDVATDALTDGAGPAWTGRVEVGSAGMPGDTRALTMLYALAGADPLAGPAVVGVLDRWQEALPGRWDAEGPTALAAGATAAFGFQAPAARAPQAVLIAVPPAPDANLDVGLVRAIVGETRLLARARTLRGRDLGPLGALLPSAVLPAGWASRFLLVGDPDTAPTTDPDLHVRLEQASPEGDLDRALRAEVADPLWMVARQWQLGEHQGENASSPVLARMRVRHTPLAPPSDRPFADPVVVPGEAVLEAAAADWWPHVGSAADPYDPTTLVHATAMAGGGARFTATAHDGGAADWWSLDADGGFRPAGRTRFVKAVPGRMRYPGAPAPGWCTIEHADDVVTAHLPDSAHVGSLFFLDVLAGHATDWYLVPLPSPPGHVLSVAGLTVVDVFGQSWSVPAATWASLDAEPWRLFRTTGLSARDLLVWGATSAPLEGPVLEQVLLGVDEDANLLWAVEEIVEGGSGGAGEPDPGDGAAWAAANLEPRMRYRPLGLAPRRWHPYPATDITPADAARRRFRQGRLRTMASDGTVDFTPLPAATTRFLRPRARDGDTDIVHELDPTAVPAGGVVVERRWVLARGLDGGPVVWQQRRRRAPLAAPAHRLAFDVAAPEIR